MPAVLLIIVGIVFVVWGSSLIIRQVDFDMHAKETIATVASVGNDRIGSRNTFAKVIGTYTVGDSIYKERLAFPIFANTLGIRTNDSVRVAYDERSPEDVKIITQSWDKYLYYVSGIFFILLGLMFGMFGILTQKHLSLPTS